MQRVIPGLSVIPVLTVIPRTANPHRQTFACVIAYQFVFYSTVTLECCFDRRTRGQD